MSYVSSLEKSSFYSDDQRSGQNSRIQPNRNSAGNGQSGSHYFPQPPFSAWQSPVSHAVSCQWEPFRKLILLQWSRLIPSEVDEAGPDRLKLSRLIQNKYGINARLVENYLRNVERALPV